MIEKYILENININLTQGMLSQLEKYCALLQEWNKKFNLTSITQTDEIYVKHFADSMLGSYAVPNSASLCDIGSGGGFPAIPLAIIRPDIKVTMVDSKNKKVDFLKFVSSELGINAKCYASRIEEFDKRNTYDIVTARAVASFSTLLEYAMPLLKIGGRAVLYKSVAESVEDAKGAMNILGAKYVGQKHFILPNGDERNIYIFEKSRAIDNKYPRGGNKPRTMPL